MERRRWILLGALGLVLAAAPGARANPPRYASGGGTGETCTAAAPCSLEAAINGTPGNHVQAHDEVIVQPGTYGGGGVPLTSELRRPGAITPAIHGVAGAPRPVIVSSSIGSALSLRDPGSTLTHIEVDQLFNG